MSLGPVRSHPLPHCPPPPRLLAFTFSGYRVQSLCNTTLDTICASCESSTYTQLWNLVTACFSCNSRCSSGESAQSKGWARASSPGLFALELAGLILDLCFHAQGHMYSIALHCFSSSIAPWGRQAKSSSGGTVPVVRVEDIVPEKVGVLVHTVTETLWPAVFMPHLEAGAEVCCLWVVGLGGKTEWAWPVEGGVTLGRLLLSRPGGNSSLHNETESHLHLQARLVLHPGEAGGLPAVRGAAQMRPWLRRGQTRYGARARGPWGTPLGLSFLGTSSGRPVTHLSTCPNSFVPPAFLIRHLLCARPWGSKNDQIKPQAPGKSGGTPGRQSH